jgi:hypothetical protein
MSSVRVHFKLDQEDGYPPVVVESLWTEAIGDGSTYLIDSIPFYVKIATLGDKISVTDEDGRLWFKSVLEISRNSLIRAVMFVEAERGRVVEHLREMGCSIEMLESRNLVAINVPADVRLLDVQQFLALLAERDVLDYEEPILRQ